MLYGQCRKHGVEWDHTTFGSALAAGCAARGHKCPAHRTPYGLKPAAYSKNACGFGIIRDTVTSGSGWWVRMKTWVQHAVWLVLIGTVACMALAGCGVSAPSGAARAASAHIAATATATPVRPPLLLGGVADGWHFNRPKYMCDAMLVVEVIVSGTGPSRWNTPDGARPATNDAVAIEKAGWKIVTPVRFSRFNILEDQRSVTTKEFLMLGGQVGQDQYWLDPFPRLAVGSSYVVVFTEDNDLATGGFTQQRMIAYDAFPIDQQNVVTLQQAGDPNEPGVGPVQQLVTIPLAQLQQDLSRCR